MVPQDAARLNSLSELSIPLRRLARADALGEAVWLAWSKNEVTWFVAGTIGLALSRERGRPVLKMKVYDREGRLEEALTCVQTRGDVWEQIDLS